MRHLQYRFTLAYDYDEEREDRDKDSFEEPLVAKKN